MINSQPPNELVMSQQMLEMFEEIGSIPQFKGLTHPESPQAIQAMMEEVSTLMRALKGCGGDRVGSAGTRVIEASERSKPE